MLAAGVVTKDSELVLCPVLLSSCRQWMQPKEMPPKAEAKTQTLKTADDPAAPLWILTETVSWYKCRGKYPDRQRRPQRLRLPLSWKKIMSSRSIC
ncbi:MAG: hypothetical protein ACLRXQ_01360 [Phascolarctobacterium faecium]